MSELRRIALYDPDAGWASHLAVALSACNLRVTVYPSPSELLTAPQHADLDAVVISWPHADPELALLVERLSRGCAVIVLLADADLSAAHLLFVSGAAEICHPLQPASFLAMMIEKTSVATQNHRLRSRLWRPTA